MNELVTHVFSLRPIRSDRLLSHRHTSKAPLGDASKRTLQAFPDLPQSPKPAKNLTESFSPAICFKVGSQVRDSSCNCLPLPGLTFIFHPLLHFPFAFSSACVIPLYFLLPLFIQSLPFAVGSNRSLNHLGQGSFAKCYPLYCSNAAVLSFCSYFGFCLHWSLLFPPVFLTSTLFTTPHSLSHHYICSLSCHYTITPVSFPWSTNSPFQIIIFFPQPTSHKSFGSLVSFLQRPASVLLVPSYRLRPCVSKSGTSRYTAPLWFAFIPFLFLSGQHQKVFLTSISPSWSFLFSFFPGMGDRHWPAHLFGQD